MSRRNRIICTLSLIFTVGAGAACTSATQNSGLQNSATTTAAATSIRPAPSATAAPTVASAATRARTRVVMLRPVTSQGTPAAGYVVFHGSVAEVEKCRASAYSTQPGLYDCGPSSANAIACAPSADGTLLCLSAVDSHVLFRVRPVDALPPPRAAVIQRPLGVQLTSGALCSAYYNGTNPTAGEAFAVYGCTLNVGIFAKDIAHPLDVSAARWTAQLYDADGTGAERNGYVRTAYFVGNNE